MRNDWTKIPFPLSDKLICNTSFYLKSSVSHLLMLSSSNCKVFICRCLQLSIGLQIHTSLCRHHQCISYCEVPFYLPGATLVSVLVRQVKVFTPDLFSIGHYSSWLALRSRT